jgi:hypothetical protein
VSGASITRVAGIELDARTSFGRECNPCP